MLFKQTQKGVQGLQAFVFCTVADNDEHTKPRFKRKLIEVKFKDCICNDLCLKNWFESDWYLCYIAEAGWF